MIRRFLVCSRANNSPETLEWLQQAVSARRPDAILFAGGVLRDHRHYEPSLTTRWGMTRDDAVFIEQFFKTLGELEVFAAVIPGTADTPIEEFLRIGMHAETKYPNVHLVHDTLIEKENIAVCGVGSRICEEFPNDFDGCLRTLAEYHLRSLWVAQSPHRIVLLATPPRGPLGRSEGSTLGRELIYSHHPRLFVVGGPTERCETQQIASTLVINPGSLVEGRAVWLDWDQSTKEQVEILNLRDPQSLNATPAMLAL